MNANLKYSLAAAALLLLGAALGSAASRWSVLGAGHPTATEPVQPAAPGGNARDVLYWYDPMVPQHKFDKPGKSPFMDMQLVPRYADETPAGAVSVDPRLAQTLGWRTAVVERQSTAPVVEVPSSLQLNEREVAIVQARSGGFVQRVFPLAPGDVIRAGQVIAELLVPEWAGAQQEFLAIRAAGDPALTSAARQRLVWLGMPESSIAELERSGQARATTTVHAPIGGLVRELSVRQGMTVAPGMTLAQITGLSSVWLEAAVPEAQAWAARPGAAVQVTLPAYPGETHAGRVAAVLPQTDVQTRTLRVRVELPNAEGRLRAGLFATARFEGQPQEMLVLPSEAVIRTGQRTLAYVVDGPGKYRPVEVEVGRDLGDRLQVISGLQAGQEVVVSGQFLIDSEASMQGLLTRQAGEAGAGSTGLAGATTHAAVGTVVELADSEITLDHGPVPALKWGAMEMAFRLPRRDLAPGIKVGDRVRFEFVQVDDGYEIRSLQREGAAR
nr:efflux RND transporter periplasmic adaptor subunit [uncultured Caldimonas sp.]